MIFGKTKIKKIELSAIITRADGTIEDLGVIARKESFWDMVKRIVFNK